MTRVLRLNKVMNLASKTKMEAMIEFIVSRMDLILAAPEEILIREGD